LLADLETAGVERGVIRDFQQRTDSVATGLPDKKLGRDLLTALRR
jgi:hypothetical protein